MGCLGGQVGAMLRHVGSCRAHVGAMLRHVGARCEKFGAPPWPVRPLLGKTHAVIGKQTVIGKHNVPKLGPCWTKLGQVGAMLGPSWCYVGQCWGYVVAFGTYFEHLRATETFES